MRCAAMKTDDDKASSQVPRYCGDATTSRETAERQEGVNCAKLDKVSNVAASAKSLSETTKVLEALDRRQGVYWNRNSTAWRDVVLRRVVGELYFDITPSAMLQATEILSRT